MVLIGATTENPSFEVNAALLSRCRVVVLKPLDEPQLRHGDASARWPTPSAAWARCTRDGRRRTRSTSWPRAADGDARTALNVLELAVTTAVPDPEGRARGGPRRPCARPSRARRCSTTAPARSTSTSSARCTSPCATPTRTPALYWLARMLEAGEDPLYVARRLVRFASEDVGLADPQALVLAMAAQQAVHFVGHARRAPWRWPSSSSTWPRRPRATRCTRAYGEAARDALSTRAEPVPLWIRNAPTGLMKDLGYGKRLPLRARRGRRAWRPWTACPKPARAGATTSPPAAAQEPAIGERLEAARRSRGAGRRQR